MDTGNVRLDISGESAHEKALLEIHSDILSRGCDESTPEVERLKNIAVLETHASALDIKCSFLKDRSGQELEYRRVKGKILSKIIKSLEQASKERYKLASSSFNLGLGVQPQEEEDESE